MALLTRRALLGAGAALAALPLTRSPGQAVPRWPKVTALVDRYVAQGKLSGAVAALGFGDGPPEAIARGSEGFDDGDEMTSDSLFRVYSMTKPVTGMAAMILIDEGRLSLDQPLSSIFPEFAAMQVAIDPARSLAARPARTAITIRHLLTHTAGFGYAGVRQDRVSRELLAHGVAAASVSRRRIDGLTPRMPTPPADEFLRRAARIPLLAEPGTHWSYSMSLDILGLAIAKVSGAPGLGVFLQERLFGPAGMTDTWFQVPREQTGRMTTNYAMVRGRHFALDRSETSIYLDPPPFAFGGAGLVTTPVDYDRFLRMLINGGMAANRRVMSARAVAMGMSNLLPEGVETRGTMIEGAGFGAGGRVGLGADEGTFGWSGAAGTTAFVNARIGLRAGLYVQFMPPGALPIQKEFPIAARDDILAGSGT